jgi:hypothetical protein
MQNNNNNKKQTNKQKKQKINETKSWSFEKLNRIREPFPCKSD